MLASDVCDEICPNEWGQRSFVSSLFEDLNGKEGHGKMIDGQRLKQSDRIFPHPCLKASTDGLRKMHRKVVLNFACVKCSELETSLSTAFYARLNKP